MSPGKFRPDAWHDELRRLGFHDREPTRLEIRKCYLLTERRLERVYYRSHNHPMKVVLDNE